MNIVFNKCIFSYLCLFYNSIMYFHEFQSIFINFRFTDIFIKISTDIFDISVKSKYRYIRNYQYFVPLIQVIDLFAQVFLSHHHTKVNSLFRYTL